MAKDECQEYTVTYLLSKSQSRRIKEITNAVSKMYGKKRKESEIFEKMMLYVSEPYINKIIRERESIIKKIMEDIDNAKEKI